MRYFWSEIAKSEYTAEIPWHLLVQYITTCVREHSIQLIDLAIIRLAP